MVRLRARKKLENVSAKMIQTKWHSYKLKKRSKMIVGNASSCLTKMRRFEIKVQILRGKFRKVKSKHLNPYPHPVEETLRNLTQNLQKNINLITE